MLNELFDFIAEVTGSASSYRNYIIVGVDTCAHRARGVK